MSASTQYHHAHTANNNNNNHEKQLEKVFERFHQTDASNTRNHEGVGLGLAISMGLVAKFEGEISVESEPGNGEWV